MSAQRPRVALVSRELAPFGGGGIGPYVRALADLLADEFEVTVLTTSRHRRAHAAIAKSAPESLPRARLVFVDEPRSWDARCSYNMLHAWSARAHAALRREYGDRGPELIEFPDFLGEGCVTVQAKRTGADWLRDTTLAVRAYGTAEMYDVLDGFVPREQERSFTYELERYALRYGDVFVWAGGDIAASYARFYGADAAPADARVLHPFAWEGAATAGAPGPGSSRPASSAPEPGRAPLRILYFGRLERRKGVRTLIDALTGIADEGWSLTMVGADTETAPLGRSMRELLSLEIAGDSRIDLRGPVSREQIPALIDSHDLVVVPSLWECWPNVALEAMQRGRPVLATPTGGMVEIVEPGRTGWLCEGTDARSLRAALGPLIADPARVREGVAEDAVRERFAALTDLGTVLDGYRELATVWRPASAPTTVAMAALADVSSASAGEAPAASAPLVSIVIPYFEMDRWIRDAVESAASQTYPATELIVVNDGSWRPEDEILLELEREFGLRLVGQPNAGLGAARNLGISLARGSFILPLDADNVLEPQFAERAVAALASDPEIAYVSSWLRYIDERGDPWKGTEEGLQPIGNSSRFVDRHNVAGDATAVFRREVFDQLSYSTDVAGFEDWALYREMRSRGLVGHVIPEPLIRYRVRGDSMMRSLSSPRERWLEQAIDAHLREREVEWTAAGR